MSLKAERLTTIRLYWINSDTGLSGDLFMSLIHTCQLAGVNPLEYLTWLLKNAQKLQTAPEDFLPWKLLPDTS